MHVFNSTKEMYMNSFVLKLSCISVFFAISGVKGEETVSPTQKECLSVVSQGCNTSCRIDIDRSYDFFVSTSFVYWQPIQENMKLGVVSQSSDSDIVNGHEVGLDFNYKPGFQVGLGMNFDYDTWDTFFEYTWFHATEKANIHLNADDVTIGLLPAWQLPDFLSPQYHSAAEEWKLKMDLLDWDLGRSYCVGKSLCIRPYIGLRSAWIRQDANISYVNTNASYALIWPSTYIDQTIRSWGIGPRIGISSNWELGKGFRIFGSGEGDILYTQYNLNSQQTSNTTTASGYSVSQNGVNYLRAHCDLDLGLGWGRYFASNKYHLDFVINYAVQVFFDQNMFRRTVSAQSLGVSTMPNGNLYLSGLTVTTRFDF
jgi:hypothetical protein